MSPHTAKQLVSVLGNVIQDYESKYGFLDVESPPSTGLNKTGLNMLPFPQTEKIAEKSGLLFQLINNLNIECGFERSFKMTERTLLGNRFLLGINSKEIQQERLLDICKRVDMPEKYLEVFKENLSGANIILFGFEENERSCVYKVYLEFWDKIKKEIHAKRNKTEPVNLHLGFKWDTQNNTKGTITRYTCFPMLSVKGILKRVSGIYEGHKERTSYEIARDMINLASSRIQNAMFIYVEVSEENNPRRSFDINLYKAELRLSELYPSLSKIYQHYSIPSEKFHILYDQNKTKIFGHLAGGIDREGNDFLTIYYEVERC